MDRIERIWALSAIWAAAKETFPYFDRLETDWDECYREALPGLLDEEDELQVWLRLAAFVRRLNDGHSTVLLPAALRSPLGWFPFGLLQLGDRFLITEARDRGQLLREVRGIDGLSMAELVTRLDRWQYTAKGHPLRGRLESWLPLLLPGREHFLQTDAGEVPFCFLPEKPELEKAPEPCAGEASRPVGEGLRLFDDGILYVRTDDFNHLERAEAFQTELARLRPRAVVFDIRRNIGGMTLCGAKYAQPFFEGGFGGCSKWTQIRKAVDAASASQLLSMREERLQRLASQGVLDRAELEEAREYAGRVHFERYRDQWQSPCPVLLKDCPVLLLVSRDTISAAEDFACFFRTNRRGLLLGEASFGSTGSPLILPLPGGGRAQIVSAGYTLADGTPFIGCGLEPDVPCVPSPEDWRSGRDRQLELALARLRRQPEGS